MPNRVIRITKRKIRLRRYLDEVKASTMTVFDWVESKWKRLRMMHRPPGRVIRIGKGVLREAGGEDYDKSGHPLNPPEESIDAVNWPGTDPHRTESMGAGLYLTSPPDGATVSGRPFVEGRVADRCARVWVVIHPTEVSDYWVQPPVSVHADGTWRVQVFIGRPGTVDVGKHFEIRACGSPYIDIEEATVLSWWPEAECQSQVIEVVRG